MNNLLKCPQCGRETSPPGGGEDRWKFCPDCGHTIPAAVRVPVPRTAMKAAGPRLWSPTIIALLSLPLGFAFGTVLVALNWHVLRRQWAATSAWVLGVVDLIVVQSTLFESFPWPWPYLLGVGVWFPIVGLPQVLYFREHFRSNYAKRGWLLPVAIGFAVQFAVVLMGVAQERSHQRLTPEQHLEGGSAAAQPLTYSTEQVTAAYQQFVFQAGVSWKERGGLFWLGWKEQQQLGSAVLIANSETEGLLVTNRHVVVPPIENPPSYAAAVRLGGDEEFVPAEVVALGRGGMDLALLHVPLRSSTPYALRAGRTSTLRPGESCIALGNALGGGIGVTAGVYSKLDSINNVHYLRTSAPISHGNSGGALIALTGPRLIGIVVASRNDGQNFNYAVPIDYVLDEQTWEHLGDRPTVRQLLRQFEDRNP